MRNLDSSSAVKLLTVATLGLLATFQDSRAVAVASGDPEDSPLYAASRQRTFAEMNARDQAPAVLQGLGDTRRDGGTIVMVEGDKWSVLPPLTHRLRVQPLDTTTDVTCSPIYCATSSSATCRTCVSYPTCSGAATCTYDVTCNNTCTYFPTCPGSGQATCGTTCNNPPTCAGYPTCNNAPTCRYIETCEGWGTTCGTAPTCSYIATCYRYNTCWATCSLGFCPAPQISSIAVSNSVPGQYSVQISFLASGSVRYIAQYSTNLDGLWWSNIFSVIGNGSSRTFVHTNEAPRAFYRILMQNP